MVEQKLKPCPWCGEQPKLSSVNFGEYYFVECGSFTAGNRHWVCAPTRTTKRGAVKAWNERRP